MKRLAVLMSVSLALVNAACSDGEAPAQRGTASLPPFCSLWDAAMTTADDDEALAALEEAPDELADEAAIVRAAQESGGDEDSEAALGAATAITQWVTANCHLTEASPGADAQDRRVAPPLDASPAGLRVCAVSSGLLSGGGVSEGGMAVYGRSDLDDPYTGPMVAVLWGPDANFSGDGESRGVSVRGTEGVVAPITVFQQVILEDLGIVVAWEESGIGVGVFGRLWAPSQTDALVSVADSLVHEGDAFTLPEVGVPAGYEKLFEGAPVGTSLLFTESSYEVHYEDDAHDSGIVTLSGFVASEEQFELFRFFALDTQRVDLNGRSAVVGHAWHREEGPTVVTWREPDGLVVRLVALGSPLDRLKELAATTRELSRAEWLALNGAEADCDSTDPDGD